MRWWSKIAVLLVLTWSCSSLIAQDRNLRHRTVKERNFDRPTWRHLVRDLQYGESHTRTGKNLNRKRIRPGESTRYSREELNDIAREIIRERSASGESGFDSEMLEDLSEEEVRRIVDDFLRDMESQTEQISPEDWENWEEWRKEDWGDAIGDYLERRQQEEISSFDENNPPELEDSEVVVYPVSQVSDVNLTFSPFMKYLLYGLIIGLLVFILYKIIASSEFKKKNKKIKTQPEEPDWENLEEHIHESDMERLLRLSKEKGDYRMAIRVQFLMIIKELSEKQWIHWKRDKTNRDYLNEVRNAPFFHPFRDLIPAFEWVWYGEADLTREQYSTMHPAFDQCLNAIQSQKTRNERSA